MTNGERRRGKRFELHLSCRVTFPPATSDSDGYAGVTRDISRSGLNVRLGTGEADGPEIGTMARIRVSLPHGPHFPQRCLHCTARVVRVEDVDSGERTVAFQVRRMQFGERELVEDAPADSTAATPSFGFLQ